MSKNLRSGEIKVLDKMSELSLPDLQELVTWLISLTDRQFDALGKVIAPDEHSVFSHMRTQHLKEIRDDIFSAVSTAIAHSLAKRKGASQ